MRNGIGKNRSKEAIGPDKGLGLALEVHLPVFVEVLFIDRTQASRIGSSCPVLRPPDRASTNCSTWSGV